MKFGKLARRTAYEQVKEVVSEISDSFGEVGVAYVTLKLLRDVWTDIVVEYGDNEKSDAFSACLGGINKEVNELVNISLDSDLNFEERTFRIICVRYPNMSKDNRIQMMINRVVSHYGESSAKQLLGHLDSEDMDEDEIREKLGEILPDLHDRIHKVLEEYSDREPYVPSYEQDDIDGMLGEEG